MNADALSRLHPLVLADLEAVVPGTSLPPPLKQALQAGGPEVNQAAIHGFPQCPPADMGALQQADPVISEVLEFWRQQRYPNWRAQAAVLTSLGLRAVL